MSQTMTAGGEVDAATLRSWMQAGEAVLIDVREADEHAAERIEGSSLAPLSKFDPGALPAAAGGRIVLHCRSGRRSGEAQARAVNAGVAGVYNLRGGIEAWKAAGLPVVRPAGRVPIPIMRQVQITAGSLVLIGTVLGAFVWPWFLVLSGFIGAGLVFAGASGMCGMAAMLSVMPWNRVLRGGACAPGASRAGG